MKREIPFTFHISRFTKSGICRVYKKNKLKDLIYIQENKPCDEQTIKGLFRSIVEPILDGNVESLILFRLEDKSKNDFAGILKRLEYSNAKVCDFSASKINDKFENVLKENIWDKTEFVYVLAERFGAVLLFDYEEHEIPGFAQIYLMQNSKNLMQSFELINSNSKIDLSEYQEKWHPDRRDNELLNSSIRKIVEILNETNQEFLISELEKENITESGDLASRLNFLMTKSSYVAHEMRNLLSICNLYSTIIEKQSDKVRFLDENAEKSIMNAHECIRKSLTMCGNLILDLKSFNKLDLKEHDLKELITAGVELAQIYSTGKDIKIVSAEIESAQVWVDENKFLSVLINLIKNAVESIEQKGEIVVRTQRDKNSIRLTISNNGKPIPKEIQAKIFEEGFTTKASGSGLGLVICKKTLEEQDIKLELKKSDADSTEFEIIFSRI